MSVCLVRRDPSTDATFRWLDGHAERVRVVHVSAESTYVDWPLSVRTVRADGCTFTGVRPSGWVPNDRLTRDGA